MTSAHAIRLYELLMQWDGVGSREVSIDWLRHAFAIEGKYQSMSDLKKYVIDPATAQINEHSPIKVRWEQRKTGRRVSHLTFKFSPKNKEAVIPAPKESKKPTSIPKALLDKFRQPGDTDEKAAQRVRAARQRAER